MKKKEVIMEKCCNTCANHHKTCFHGSTNLRNFMEKECRRTGPPYYRSVESGE